jgi:hypothetical protein
LDRKQQSLMVLPAVIVEFVDSHKTLCKAYPKSIPTDLSIKLKHSANLAYINEQLTLEDMTSVPRTNTIGAIAFRIFAAI